MKYGLTSTQLNLILECFKTFPEIEKVILFGSRAMGNYKPFSDLDLLPIGTRISDQIIARLSACLNEEISVPFRFDLIREPLSEDLKNHIDRYGVVIFEATSG